MPFKLWERLSHLPIWGHASDSQLLLDDGSNFAMIEVQGATWETRAPGEVQAMWDRLNHTMKNIASPNIILTVYQCRLHHSTSIYPGGKFRNEFSRNLDEAYKNNLLSQILYDNRTYIGIQVRPGRHMGEAAGEYLSLRQSAPVEDPDEERMDRLTEVVTLLMTDLRAYRPRRLGIRMERFTCYSEIAEAIVLAMTGTERKIPLTTGKLGEAMFSEHMHVLHDQIVYTLPGTMHYGAAFGMKHFPTPTVPGMFANLLASPYRSTTFHHFRFIPTNAAQGIMKRKTYIRRTAEDPATEQTDDLGRAVARVGQDFVMGDYSFTHLIFANTPEALDDTAMVAWSLLADSGLIVAREVTALEPALFSIAPGNARLRPRPGYISSKCFTAMAPLHAYPKGEPADGKPHWGGPVTIFRTRGGIPYKFHLHVRDIGNTFVCGRTGSGKTTWLGFVISQAERLGATTVLFDKDYGLKILVNALGGTYLELNVPTGLAPLKALTNSESDLTFLGQLMRGCIMAGNGKPLTEEEQRRLRMGLETIMELPPEERELWDLRASLGVEPEGAGSRLEKWCRGNEFGGIIDNERDVVSLDAPVLGFDQTKILDNQWARGPVMATLYHYVDKLIDGRRLLFVIDEFWKSLQDESFRSLVNDKLRTLRKQNSPMLLSTQSPKEALDSAISTVIKDQCPTQIFFGNNRADPHEYGIKTGIGLTSSEIGIVKDLDIGQFLLKQDNISVPCQLLLDGMEDEISILSTGRTAYRVFTQIETSQQEQNVKRFLEAKKEVALW